MIRANLQVWERQRAFLSHQQDHLLLPRKRSHRRYPHALTFALQLSSFAAREGRVENRPFMAKLSTKSVVAPRVRLSTPATTPALTLVTTAWVTRNQCPCRVLASQQSVVPTAPVQPSKELAARLAGQQRMHGGALPQHQLWDGYTTAVSIDSQKMFWNPSALSSLRVERRRTGYYRRFSERL